MQSTVSRDVIRQWPFLGLIVEKARELLGPCRVILFGSRARGDFRDSSDFDVAVEHKAPPGQWASFVVAVKEAPITLHDLDIVDLNQADTALQKAIRKEGISLHG